MFDTVSVKIYVTYVCHISDFQYSLCKPMLVLYRHATGISSRVFKDPMGITGTHYLTN